MIIDNEIKINKKENKNESKKLKGFTLIEVMVSVSLFAMVMTLSLGAILSIIDGNKKAQAINSVANNLNFAVDSMVRDIKTGYSYTCSGIMPDPTASSNVIAGNNQCNAGDVFDFINLVSTITGEKRAVGYYLGGVPGKGRILKQILLPDGVTVEEYPITSPEVDITKLQFHVDNPVSADYAGQPKVFLIIEGTATINPTQTSDFKIQTLISQRNLNLPK
jgi:prepilin-type N-terminal cleavage/methylation domain-containing protein